MATETDLLNDALGLIGAERITAIDDGSTNSNYCASMYPAMRDSLLRSHHWNFAVTRVELAQDVTAPVFGYAYSYSLPANCLKVIDYGGALPVSGTAVMVYPFWPYNQRNVVNYKIEGRKLYSNDGQALIVYLRQETNPALWDPMFYQAVVHGLASKLANAIRKDPKLSLALLQQSDHYWGLAAAVDGQEGSTQAFISDDLTWGR